MYQDSSKSFLEETISDSQEVILIKTKVNPQKIILGYGKCKSCGCKGWRPNYPKNDYCKDCGHHWSRHE